MIKLIIAAPIKREKVFRMKLSVIQHVPFEGPAAIKEWTALHHIEMNIYELFNEDKLPRSKEIDFLVILGGPMSANSSEFKWMEKERQLILELINQNKPILGICLGAQQIAKALGSGIFQGAFKEIGWHVIQTTTGRFNFLPKELTAFHWHGEQFDLPGRAERLFSSEACENQGFLYNKNVIGLQFHLESTKESVHSLIENDREYMYGSKYVQSEQEILDYNIPPINKEVLFLLMDFMYKSKG